MKLAPHTPIALQVAMERARSRGPVLPIYKAGHGYCEGCKTYQLRSGKAVKGWRCRECRNTKERN